jgi:hypothetical protein
MGNVVGLRDNPSVNKAKTYPANSLALKHNVDKHIYVFTIT